MTIPLDSDDHINVSPVSLIVNISDSVRTTWVYRQHVVGVVTVTTLTASIVIENNKPL